VIPLSPVRLGEDEERLALEVIRSGRLTQGPMVERLEEAFREVVGTDYAIAVSSGTTALVASLQAVGVEPGDEIITSPFSFVATLNAILETGARAKFADILDDFTLNPEAIEAAITGRTTAIMPVHLYGYPADMTRISAIAETHDLALIEDAAQAHGAQVQGRPVGSFGLGCFSFYATKNVTMGEGGIICANDFEIADRLRLLRNQGMRQRYQYEIPGHNYRLSELQAAVGLPQLARLPDLTKGRQHNASRLNDGLAGLPGIKTPQTPQDRTHVFHQYTIRVTAEAAVDRDALAEGLAALGIETGVYYPRAVYDYDCYRTHPQVESETYPEAEAAAREVLSLPVHPWLSDTQLDEVVEGVRSVVHPAL